MDSPNRDLYFSTGGLLRLRLSASNRPEPNSLKTQLYDGDRELVPTANIALSRIGLRPPEKSSYGIEQKLSKSPRSKNRDLARQTYLNEEGRRWFSSLAKRLPPDKVLWLDMARPKGSLSLYPWELWLQPLFQRPVLRLPRHLFEPAQKHGRRQLVYCSSAPLAKGPVPIIEVLRSTVEELEAAAIPATVHVFVDAEVEDAVRNDLPSQWSADGTLQIYPATSAGLYSLEEAPEGTRADDLKTARSAKVSRTGLSNPWLCWMNGALQGSVDLVHFVTHGYLSRGRGSLAFARSPMVNDDPRWARFVDGSELTTFLDAVGSSGLVLTSPPDNYNASALYAVADEVVDARPGTVLVHDGREDFGGKELAAALTFLFRDSQQEAQIPAFKSLSFYILPNQVLGPDDESHDQASETQPGPASTPYENSPNQDAAEEEAAEEEAKTTETNSPIDDNDDDDGYELGPKGAASYDVGSEYAQEESLPDLPLSQDQLPYSSPYERPEPSGGLGVPGNDESASYEQQRLRLERERRQAEKMRRAAEKAKQQQQQQTNALPDRELERLRKESPLLYSIFSDSYPEKGKKQKREEILNKYTLADKLRSRRKDLEASGSGEDQRESSGSRSGGDSERSSEGKPATKESSQRWVQSSQRILERYVSQAAGSVTAKTSKGRAAQKGVEDAFLFLKQVLAKASDDPDDSSGGNQGGAGGRGDV